MKDKTTVQTEIDDKDTYLSVLSGICSMNGVNQFEPSYLARISVNIYNEVIKQVKFKDK